MNRGRGSFHRSPRLGTSCPSFFGFRPSSLAICTCVCDRWYLFCASCQRCKSRCFITEHSERNGPGKQGARAGSSQEMPPVGPSEKTEPVSSGKTEPVEDEEGVLVQWARRSSCLVTRLFLRGVAGRNRMWREVVTRAGRGEWTRSSCASVLGWATAGSLVVGRGADRDRMTRLPSRGSSDEPLAELDQGLGQECACDERFGRLNTQVHAALKCSRVDWSSQPMAIAATR
jgi:hypothetical protein